jgi:DNA invertase Pin-like site-specific DNA recombinase
MNDKIKPQHLGRKVVLYIRQSSAYQVANNLESQRLQYGMRDRLEQFGWNNIEVIDEDLGQSASGSVVRSGFERLVASVCMGEVGAVAARELSRFARNSREWQQLIEVCRVVDTILIDNEQVYSPRVSNDRLLLGLKGSLNEYELDILRQRSLEARYAKAKRGELLVAVPVGFLKTEEQRYELDPNKQVQDRIRLVFSKFFELGSVRQTLLWFLEEELQIPTRNAKGELSWVTPRFGGIYKILDNPAYAGAYAYGRTEHGHRYENGTTKKVARRRKRSEWLTFIPNHHEGYISLEQYEQIRRMLDENCRSFQKTGAVRRGPALLSGLFRCRRCGRKLTVAYSGVKPNRFARYCCVRGHLDIGEPKCIAFGAAIVDVKISQEILRVVQPAALEASRLAMEKMNEQADAVLAALQTDLEAAKYQASRAQRQYDAADPENRLVTDELERRWNAALRAVADLELRIHEHQASHSQVTGQEWDELQDLAADLETVWESQDCDERLKKRILRTLIKEIVVDLDEVKGEIHLTIHWNGGVHTNLVAPRRKRGSATRTSADAIEAVRILTLIATDEMIAGVLNRNGLRTGRGNRFTKERIVSLRNHHQIPVHNPDERIKNGWMTLHEAADYLGVSPRTLRIAAEADEIPGRHPLKDGPWVFSRADLDAAPAQAIKQRARSRNRKEGAVPNSKQQNLDFSGT